MLQHPLEPILHKCSDPCSTYKSADAPWHASQMPSGVPKRQYIAMRAQGGITKKVGRAPPPKKAFEALVAPRGLLVVPDR